MTDYRYEAVHRPVCRCAFNQNIINHMELQDAVVQQLGEDQDILHVMDYQGWEKLLDDERHVILTSSCPNGELAGQAVVLLPNSYNDDADMIDMTLPSDNPNDLATFRTIMTDPRHRGNNIMERLLEKSKEIARENGRRYFLGCITRSNAPSWSQFLKTGMLITGGGFDPSDDSTVYYAMRDDKNPIFYSEVDTLIVSPDVDLLSLTKIFKEGYVGIAGEKDLNNAYTGRLIMAHRL